MSTYSTKSSHKLIMRILDSPYKNRRYNPDRYKLHLQCIVVMFFLDRSVSSSCGRDRHTWAMLRVCRHIAARDFPEPLQSCTNECYARSAVLAKGESLVRVKHGGVERPATRLCRISDSSHRDTRAVSMSQAGVGERLAAERKRELAKR